MLNAAPLTRPQREELLRLLLIGRGLERVLSSLRRRSGGSAGEAEAVLAAIAAAAGLQPGDRLVAPHGFLTAHLAGGVGPAEIAAARLREPRARSGEDRRMLAAVGPQSPVGIAVGIAFALSRSGRRDAAVALVDRRWAEEEGCRGALSLARELALPLVVVAIDTGATTEGGAPVVDRRDFEAIRVAVAAAISAAHDDRGPSLVVCAPGAPGERGTEHQVARFRTRVEDPVSDYERWLMIHGFSRAELDGIRRLAAGELDDAVGDRVANTLGRRIAPEGITG
jgi:TPP-dependent pyruvate/acetoin dehydrogenase alpha subunit